MNVGARIKARREELGMSQGELAKKMGVSRQAISKAESHDGSITTAKLDKFAKYLDISSDFLLYGETSRIVDAPKTSEELSAEMMSRMDRYDQMLEIMDKFDRLPPDRKELVLRILDTWGVK